MEVFTGLDQIDRDKQVRERITGNIALLCHSASIDRKIRFAPEIFQEHFGDRLKALFGPQHGIISDLQDNMIESDHSFHPHYKLPVYSLYSETRSPTAKMLEGIDTLVVDLQDVGTRIYTYIYTMTLAMKVCAELGIKVVVLDRPNPINAETIEGNILESAFTSFVGLHPLPVRHALTIGEVALMAKTHWSHHCELEVIAMKGYQRKMSFEETGLPWVLPSPNLPTVDSAYTFVGSVLLEGTNISEGRGTTRSLEILGHPHWDPFKFLPEIQTALDNAELRGQTLRPLYFRPTFQKHGGVTCGGYQVHVTDREKFKPWRVFQILLKMGGQLLGENFSWKEPPYEYEYDREPIDLINGSDRFQDWYKDPKLNPEFLDQMENEQMQDYQNKRDEILLY